jgi:hypothetical protein
MKNEWDFKKIVKKTKQNMAKGLPRIAQNFYFAQLGQEK